MHLCTYVSKERGDQGAEGGKGEESMEGEPRNVTCRNTNVNTAKFCVSGLKMHNHPKVGLNLLMAWDDRLIGGAGTPTVSQRAETGQGIMGGKGSKGKCDMLYDAVC